jgi:hypothetical protein
VSFGFDFGWGFEDAGRGCCGGLEGWMSEVGTEGEKRKKRAEWDWRGWWSKRWEQALSD